MQVVKYVFQPHGDDRGQLVALEEFIDIPFEIKRVYYMYETGEGVRRGFHAHKSLEQILIMGHVKFFWITVLKRKLFHWKNHTKDCTYLMICGEKCMIFLPTQYCLY